MKDAPVEANEVIAMCDIAGFGATPASISPAELIDVLHRYLSLIFKAVDSSGGTPQHTYGNAVLAFWTADTSSQARAKVGAALAEILTSVGSLTLSNGARCVPAVGVAVGPTVHVTLPIAERRIPIASGPSVNLAMRLSSSCAMMKKKILFPVSLPVTWPPRFTSEDVAPIAMRGEAEPLRLMSLVDKNG